MTNTNLFLDSSIWLDYFLRHEMTAGQLIDHPEGKLFTSIVCFHEVVRRLIRLKKNEAYINEVTRFMRENSTVVSVNEEIAVKSAHASVNYRLASMDSIVYQSALSVEALLISGDNDFRGLPKSQVLKL